MSARWAALLRAPITALLLASGAAAFYLALFSVAQALLGPAVAWLWALVSAASLAIVIPVVEPLRIRAERVVERIFFPAQARTRRALREALREIARIRGEEELAAFVRQRLQAALEIERVCVLAGAPGEPLRELGLERDAGLTLAPEDTLAAALRAGESALADAAGSLASARLHALGFALAVGLPPLPQLHGAILLGPRREPYDSDERALLEVLAGQAIVAIANARAWEEIRRLELRLREENTLLREAAFPSFAGHELVGSSAALGAVLAQVTRVAPTDASVLLLGETGTGKELLAAAVHRASARAERAFVQVACAALPEALLESELFGHERGAFTGAVARKLGRFEVADGGTLFLDDVDTLPLAVQAKLLRALQEGEVQRLGSTQTQIVDVRVIAASNRDLLAEVRAGRFRGDLYYRLHVVPIRVPALRERPDDIPMLAAHFASARAKPGQSAPVMPQETLAALTAYAWPGNVRELRNVIERAAVMSPDGVLRLQGPLDGVLSPSAKSPLGARAESDLGKASLAELVRREKKRLALGALARCDGSQRRAAELLGIHRPSLSRMLRDLGAEAEA